MFHIYVDSFCDVYVYVYVLCIRSSRKDKKRKRVVTEQNFSY